MKKWRRLIVALDIENEERIKSAVRILGKKVNKFKVGPIAFTRWGPDLVRYIIHRQKKEVFLDLKLYDIPNTMIKASWAIAELGVWAFTVHLSVGEESLKRIKQQLISFCRQKKIRQPLIIGVSQLTSKRASLKQVLKLAKVAASSRIDGVVCASQEAGSIKKRFKRMLVITPGIRTKITDDQKRIATASLAFSQGADYIVVGRPIINETDILRAAERVLSS